jgi:two-component system OmpR family sensor kinase
MESGIATLDQHFFVSEVAAIVVHDARFEAEEKGVDIKFVPDSGRPPNESMVVGSGKLVSRAIENVVRNALRFSHRGDAITLDLDSNSSGTTLNIRDDGPGVKADQLEMIFEPFVQVGTLKGQGHGLGLAIAKRAIVAHRGFIKATNGAHGGLTITIWLPAAPNSAESYDESHFLIDPPVLIAGQ